MPLLPEPITRLVAALGRLPGVGPRSAERIALFLVQESGPQVLELAEVIVSTRQKVSLCGTCGSLTETQPCSLCDDPRRDSSLVCVVEKPVDILSIEKSGAFRGKYHVLGGKLSPLDGVEPEDLRITELEERLGREAIQEIILAMGTDVEGDATCHYLSKRLAAKGVNVTRIAHGLPAGSGLEFADEVTLSHALAGRRKLG